MSTTTSVTAVVDADPDAVFATVTDLGRLPEWNAAIRRVVESPSELGVGAEWVVEMHALGQNWHSRSRAEEIDRTARVFRYRSCTDDGNPSYANWRWSVTPNETGGSRVTVTSELNPKTFWRKALLVHIRRRQLTGHEIANSLQALAKTAKASAARG
jgi:uncharacterized protein YndB with AHSA1/START domain